MGQLLIRNIDDQVIESFKTRALIAGKPLEQYLREFLAHHATMTSAERVAFARSIREHAAGLSPQMSKEEIREGLE